MISYFGLGAVKCLSINISPPMEYLFDVLQPEWNPCQEFPHTGGQVEVQGFLCSDGHPKENAQELKHCEVIFSKPSGI